MNNRSWIPFFTSWWTSRPMIYEIVTYTHIGLYAEILGDTLVAFTTNLGFLKINGQILTINSRWKAVTGS